MSDHLRFKIGENVYSAESLDEVRLRDIMLFNTQSADMGLRYTWDDIERAVVEMRPLKPKDSQRHPMALVVFGVTVWAARRIAGEDVTLEQAVDFPLSSLTLLQSPEDRKPDPTKARKGKPKRGKPKGNPSARAASPSEAAEPPPTPPTSE